MALPLPNLDDKSFLRIVEEARALIPSTAPEWTDHNVHDPGITFIELFAWLAEIEHYRLNNTSAAAYSQFFSMAGLTPFGQQAAEVTVALKQNDPAAGVFVPANSRAVAIGKELLPFETTRDVFLTKAELKKVITRAGGREIVQTRAQDDDVAHFEAFGPAPQVGDSIELGFKNWFDESKGHLTIKLFEDDLPAPAPLTEDAQSFFSSAELKWEQLTSTGWDDLDLLEDSTLNLSRTGNLVFSSPDKATERGGLKWLRARIERGQYEIPPRILRIQTNTIHARQIQTIVNEDLGRGLGQADQQVRLAKYPVYLTSQINNGPFQVGDVLQWHELIKTLSAEPGDDAQSKAVAYVAKRLKAYGVELDPDNAPDIAAQNVLAEAFNRLINETDFYGRGRGVFGWVPLSTEFAEATARPESCEAKSRLRRLNRFLLERLFRDQIVSDRVEIQTADVDNRPVTWDPVDTFAQSGPDDRHYRLDAQSGVILFGNGLNGRVPRTTESIQARFYRYSQADQGNLSAGQQWLLALLVDARNVSFRGRNLSAAGGGRVADSLEESKLKAREIFRKRSPVITAGDYETLALATPGLRVARAKALPNYNPNFGCLRLPGDVTVIVVPTPPPASSFPNAKPPEPSKGFLQTVQTYLDQRRLVTTTLHVIGPEYVPVAVSCRVFLKKHVSESEARESVERALRQMLDPVFGGPTKSLAWPFGRSVFPSEINQRLAQVPAVDYLLGVRINDLKVGEPLSLPYNGLPTSGAHHLRLISFERRAEKEADCKHEGPCD